MKNPSLEQGFINELDKMGYEKAIRNASSIYDLFSIVKEIVGRHTGIERLNTEIIFRDFGFNENGFIGALYYPYLNTIAILLSQRVMNKTEK